MLLDLDYVTFDIPDTDASIKIRPLDVKTYQLILKVMSSIDTGVDETIAGMRQLSNPELLELASVVIPNFSKDLKGIKIKHNGEVTDATTDDLLKHGALLQVCFTIIMQIFSISGISMEETKEVKK